MIKKYLRNLQILVLDPTFNRGRRASSLISVSKYFYCSQINVYLQYVSIDRIRH